MKHSLKFCRFSLVLLLALTVAFSAAVGVSAATGTENAALLYIDNQGESITRISENNNVAIMPYALGIRSPLPFYENSTYVVVVNINTSLISPLSAFNNNTLYAGYTSTVLTNINSGTGNLFSSINAAITEKSSSGVEITLTFNTNNIDSASQYLQYFWEPNTDLIININYVNTTIYYTTDEEETELDKINNSLNEIINNQELNQQEINQSLNTIIENQITQNNNWNTIINYGANYSQIDQNIINGLGSAEDQLSSAEGALEDKSQSLKDSVASQWSNIQSTSKTFITNLAPAAAAVGTVTTQFMDAAPEEVKGLFVTIPLLIFIGWLIGRIRGD